MYIYIYIYVNALEFELEWCFYLQTTQATKDTNCESVVTSGQHNLTTQHPPRDASPAGLVGLSLLAPILSLWSETTWLCINGLWNYVLFFFPGFCPLQKRL